MQEAQLEAQQAHHKAGASYAQSVLSLCSLCHIMQALCNHMLTLVQHNDELVQQCLWDAQTNKFTLCTSMLGPCSNTLTQRAVAFIPIAQGLHSSCTGRAF